MVASSAAKSITNSGHHVSIQDCDSWDELIATSSSSIFKS